MTADKAPKECIICYAEEKDGARFGSHLRPCQHYREVCSACRPKMKGVCPVCRAPWILDVPSGAQSLTFWGDETAEGYITERRLVRRARTAWYTNRNEEAKRVIKAIADARTVERANRLLEEADALLFALIAEDLVRSIVRIGRMARANL